MYFPYFRGKQYELIAIRENASRLAKMGFQPIVEPVRETLSGTRRTLDAVLEESGSAILIVNPHHGELSGVGAPLTEMLKAGYRGQQGISAGILLKEDTSVDEAITILGEHELHTPVFIHAGFKAGKALADQLGSLGKMHVHVFVENYCGKLYQRPFKDAFRVLARDGFKRQKTNRDYPDSELFSDLHVTYPDEGMDGFGDFLIVGDDYLESGGLPYVLAIHVTFIDPDLDDSMQIYHFKSKPSATQKDPAGKFAEALVEMMKIIDSPGSKVFETEAIKEFRDLYERGHFPGLGQIKKLSMSHHIETLATYFNKAV